MHTHVFTSFTEKSHYGAKPHFQSSDLGRRGAGLLCAVVLAHTDPALQLTIVGGPACKNFDVDKQNTLHKQIVGLPYEARFYEGKGLLSNQQLVHSLHSVHVEVSFFQYAF